MIRPFAERLLDRRQPPPSMQLLELSYYVNGLLWARTLGSPTDMRPHDHYSFTLLPQLDARDYVRVDLVVVNSIGPWQYVEATSELNGSLFGARRPVTYWAAEPTPDATGMCRWEFAHPDGDDIHAYMTVRRSQ